MLHKAKSAPQIQDSGHWTTDFHLLFSRPVCRCSRSNIASHRLNWSCVTTNASIIVSNFSIPGAVLSVSKGKCQEISVSQDQLQKWEKNSPGSCAEAVLRQQEQLIPEGPGRLSLKWWHTNGWPSCSELFLG